MFDFNPLNTNESSVDLAPLIDVLFLLLVFFILTMASSFPSIEVALSEAKTAEQKSKELKEQVIFSIDENGTLFFGQENISKDEIAKALENYKKDGAVIFNVDKVAHFSEFISTIDEVKALGYTNFYINALHKD